MPQMPQFLDQTMTIVSDPHRACVTVAGEVDASNSDRLRRAIVAAAIDHNAEVEVDLAGVTFMDSTGFRAMATAAAVLETSGLALVVCNVPRNVRRILEIVDSGRTLTVRA